MPACRSPVADLHQRAGGRRSRSRRDGSEADPESTRPAKPGVPKGAFREGGRNRPWMPLGSEEGPRGTKTGGRKQSSPRRAAAGLGGWCGGLYQLEWRGRIVLNKSPTTKACRTMSENNPDTKVIIDKLDRILFRQTILLFVLLFSGFGCALAFVLSHYPSIPLANP